MARRPMFTGASSRPEDIFAIAVAAYILFSLLDCFTTAVALADGCAYERNPFAASIYAAHGTLGLYLVKFAVVAVVVAGMRILPRNLATWLATLFTATVALAVVANLHVLLYG